MPLADRFFVRIADITCAIQSVDPALTVQIPGATRNFLTRETKPDVTIQARWDDLSRLSVTGRRIFDSGAVWQLYQENGMYLFTFNSTSFDTVPYKIAQIRQDFSCTLVSVHLDYCDPEQPLYPLDYPLHELLFSHLLALGRGAEIHACGLVDSRGTGHLFVGQSEAGKTTMARLWQKEPGVTVLSDDRIILRRKDNQPWMYGTPWHGEARLSDPGKAPLGHVYFLRHGTKNDLLPLGPSTAVGRFLACSFPPFYSPEGLDFTLRFLEQVVRAVPCYQLSFVPDKRVVEFLHELQD